MRREDRDQLPLGGLPTDLRQRRDHLGLEVAGGDGREARGPREELRDRRRVAELPKGEGGLDPHRGVGVVQQAQQHGRARAVPEATEGDGRTAPDQRVGVPDRPLQQRGVELPVVLDGEEARHVAEAALILRAQRDRCRSGQHGEQDERPMHSSSPSSA